MVILPLVNSECIIWTKYKNKKGYGSIQVNKKRLKAHRFAWEQVNGPIPKDPNGLTWEIDHECKVPACVNIEHLKLVPPGFNGKQGHASQSLNAKNKTHCLNGHEYNEKNTYIHLNKYKRCKLCKTKYDSNRYQINQIKEINYAATAVE